VTTAHGIPYPAGSDPVHGIPQYLTSLGEAVHSRILSAGGAGLTVARFAGALSPGSSPLPGVNGPRFCSVPFPTIRWVRGAVVQRTGQYGNVVLPYVPVVWPTWQTQSEQDPVYQFKAQICFVNTAAPTGTPPNKYATYVMSGSIGAFVIAWGDPA
jgi:hypothetical protein